MSFDFDEFDELISAQIPARNITEETPPIFSVSDFIEVANQNFGQNFPEIFIEGEVSSFKINQKKFVFFDLKDENSTLPCFMTVWQMRFPLEDGMKIMACVTPKITAWGKFSLTVSKIIPKGEGSLKRSFEILKEKLTREGIFSAERKRQIPKNPKNIGVISSVQAAGFADFVKILNERSGGAKVRVAHTQVQGIVAANQIIRAIDFFNQSENLPDVIVLIRGGGSADDLAVFNDEDLVRAISKSRVPILTGIGHEIDESLADLAADFAASTPSNAAQILTSEKDTEIQQIFAKIWQTRVKILQQIELLRFENRHNISKIRAEILRNIEEKKAEIRSKIRLLESLNPEKILRQGYAIIRGELAEGGEIRIETNQEIILAEVKNVRKK